MKKSDQTFLITLGVIVFSAYMLSNPKCGAGCKTVFQHILNHELDILL